MNSLLGRPMKIAYKEIWEFVETFSPGVSCNISLCIGEKVIHDIPCNIICDVQKDPAYPADLLDMIFTKKEVFWEPKDFRDMSTYAIKLNLVCHEYRKIIETLKKNDDPAQYIYADILAHCLKMIQRHKENVAQQNGKALGEIGRFRCDCLPFFVFFIEHPKTQKNEKREALRKFSYMMKKLLLEHNENFHRLVDGPYWEVAKKEETSLERKTQEKEDRRG